MALLRLRSGKKPDRKKKIVEAAGELLIEGGIAQLNLLRVAMKSGVTPDQLNLHFNNRDGLIDALGRSLAHENMMQFRLLASKLANNNTPPLLENLMDGLLDHAADKRNARICAELRAMANQNEATAQAIHRLHEDTRRIFAQTLGLMPEHVAAARFVEHLQLLTVIAEGVSAMFAHGACSCAVACSCAANDPAAGLERIKRSTRELLLPLLRVELQAALQAQRIL